MRAMMLLPLMILATSCSVTSAGPTVADSQWVPCDQLFGARYSPSAIAAMSDQEARTALANARVIRKRCGK